MRLRLNARFYSSSSLNIDGVRGMAVVRRGNFVISRPISAFWASPPGRDPPPAPDGLLDLLALMAVGAGGLSEHPLPVSAATNPHPQRCGPKGPQVAGYGGPGRCHKASLLQANVTPWVRVAPVH